MEFGLWIVECVSFFIFSVGLSFFFGLIAFLIRLCISFFSCSEAMVYFPDSFFTIKFFSRRERRVKMSCLSESFTALLISF